MRLTKATLESIYHLETGFRLVGKLEENVAFSVISANYSVYPKKALDGLSRA